MDDGGSARSLFILVRELSKRHKISIVSLAQPSELKGTLSRYHDLGVDVYGFRWGWLPVSYVGCQVREELENSICERMKHTLPSLRELIAQADAVCFNGYPTSRLASNLPKDIPKYLIAREVVMRKSEGYNATGAFLRRYIKHAIPIGPEEARQLSEWDIPHTMVFNTGALPPCFHPLPSAPPVHFGVFGQILRTKGQYTLLQGCAQYADALRANRAKVHLFGSDNLGGAEGIQLAKYIWEHKIKDIASLDGWTAEVEETMSTMHCIVRPDFTGSPWGRDVIEAMSIGRPVLATGENTVFVQPDVTGRLVPPKDPAALGRALVDLSGDPGALERYAANAFAFAREHFDPATNAAAIERILTRS